MEYIRAGLASVADARARSGADADPEVAYLEPHTTARFPPRALRSFGRVHRDGVASAPDAKARAGGRGLACRRRWTRSSPDVREVLAMTSRPALVSGRRRPWPLHAGRAREGEDAQATRSGVAKSWTCSERSSNDAAVAAPGPGEVQRDRRDRTADSQRRLRAWHRPRQTPTPDGDRVGFAGEPACRDAQRRPTAPPAIAPARDGLGMPASAPGSDATSPRRRKRATMSSGRRAVRW